MWPNNFHFSHLSLSSVFTTFIFGPASLNVVFSELSHAQGRKVKSQPPLPSHFKTPTSNTSCRDLQNGTSPHSADTFSHLVPHRDEALSQTPHRKEKSWKAFYVNLDQLELPPKERRLWTSLQMVAVATSPLCLPLCFRVQALHMAYMCTSQPPHKVQNTRKVYLIKWPVSFCAYIQYTLKQC